MFTFVGQDLLFTNVICKLFNMDDGHGIWIRHISKALKYVSSTFFSFV